MYYCMNNKVNQPKSTNFDGLGTLFLNCLTLHGVYAAFLTAPCSQRSFWSLILKNLSKALRFCAQHTSRTF